MLEKTHKGGRLSHNWVIIVNKINLKRTNLKVRIFIALGATKKFNFNDKKLLKNLPIKQAGSIKTINAIIGFSLGYDKS